MLLCHARFFHAVKTPTSLPAMSSVSSSRAPSVRPGMGQVHANGQPIDIGIALQAAEWLTTLMSGEATASDKEAWRHWHDANPDHARAWQHIERVSGQLQHLDGHAARQALTQRPVSRRKAVNLLLWLSGIGVIGWSGLRSTAGQSMLADFSTATGERRSFTLADGSQLDLNTDSAANMRYSATQRRVELIKGELFIATAAEQPPVQRPFFVETLQGQALALGTRYSVRQRDDRTMVVVEQGAVKLTPRHGSDSLIIQAGQRAAMTADNVLPVQTATADDWGWRKGQILADGMRLRDFLLELSRYRTGLLGCDDSVADLRISGVFPLADTDAILLSLSDSLPVRLRFRNAPPES